MKQPPKYLSIANKIRHEILTGEYNVNDQLPKEYDLSKAYNVSRITIRGALDELEKQGLIYRIQGAGTYVKKQEITTNINSDALELINLKKYTLKILDFEIGQISDQFVKKLNIRPYDIVYTIKRAAMSQKEIVAFQELFIPAKVIQGLNMEMMESSIYPLIEEKLGLKPNKALRDISLVYATDTLLKSNKVNNKISTNEPLLKWKQQTYLSDGKIFEYNQTYYRISKFPIKEAIVL